MVRLLDYLTLECLHLIYKVSNESFCSSPSSHNSRFHIRKLQSDCQFSCALSSLLWRQVRDLHGFGIFFDKCENNLQVSRWRSKMTPSWPYSETTLAFLLANLKVILMCLADEACACTWRAWQPLTYSFQQRRWEDKGSMSDWPAVFVSQSSCHRVTTFFH